MPAVTCSTEPPRPAVPGGSGRRRLRDGDLVAGTGIEPAVDGVSAIVHCASDNKGDAEAARNLVAAAG